MIPVILDDFCMIFSSESNNLTVIFYLISQNS
jgi:hypothetical protein